MKPGTSPLQSTRILDQVRERIRHLHYSLSTEFGFTSTEFGFSSAGMAKVARCNTHG